MRKVGRLIDKYLGEISPDQGLKVSKFLAVTESLPDSARDCYDGVYRALDLYLEVSNSSNISCYQRFSEFGCFVLIGVVVSVHASSMSGHSASSASRQPPSPASDLGLAPHLLHPTNYQNTPNE
jgi:hypothetical protein